MDTNYRIGGQSAEWERIPVWHLIRGRWALVGHFDTWEEAEDYVSSRSYPFETGQLYALGHSASADDSTLEIEIGNVCGTGPRARVTFYVYELHPSGARTAQGSATVPASWLAHTLTAHRAYLLTECTGHVPVY